MSASFRSETGTNGAYSEVLPLETQLPVFFLWQSVRCHGVQVRRVWALDLAQRRQHRGEVGTGMTGPGTGLFTRMMTTPTTAVAIALPQTVPPEPPERFKPAAVPGASTEQARRRTYGLVVTSVLMRQ